MEGPTPVSALIHAATMVTAGVFLVIKCSPLFEYISSVLVFITIIGACTAFFAASIGLVQSDIKKVIAYSTCSQLGYMFFICGLSGYNIALFHLINHAFFKALLFLSAGAIIHAVHNEQDVRRYGGLLRILPFTYIMMVIGSFSLMGFPFLTGYYSKDLILEFAFASYSLPGVFAYWLGTITAFLTAFYSLRIIYLTFITKTNLYKKICEQAEELPYKMTLSLSLLACGSIFFGYISRDLFVGMGYDFWNTSIMIQPENNNFVDAEFVPLFIKLFPLGLTIVATVFV
jgi:NADH-ubiquinone oxidoreductase chain 5